MSRFLAIVKEGEVRRKVSDLCRTHGITEQTYYRWKSKYGGLELSELKRLKQLEDENRRLKYLVAEQTLDIQALKAVVAKRWWAQSRGAWRWSGSWTRSMPASDAPVGSSAWEYGDVPLPSARAHRQPRATRALQACRVEADLARTDESLLRDAIDAGGLDSMFEALCPTRNVVNGAWD